MRNKKIKSIILCSSISFSKQNWDIKQKLEKTGFKVIIEHTAKAMKRTGNWRGTDYKRWYQDPKLFREKAKLMKRHFDAIAKGDAILVVNLKKKGIEGYIGGNVLMEMGLAFYLKKTIFLLNPVSKNSPFYEEVMGMMPKVLGGEFSKLMSLRA